MIDLGNVAIGPDGKRVYNRYHELSDSRPCVILSNDVFNASRAELVIVVPLTSDKEEKMAAHARIASHVRILSPEGGLGRSGFAICEGIRSVARQYLIRRVGDVTPQTLREIEVQLRDLLDF